MDVTKDTKISHILKENENAIHTIASINKHFSKLANPILRKVFASRVSVKEASKIGNVSVNDFLKKLADIGFNVIYENNEKETEVTPIKPKTINQKINILDVRPTINAGADPFKDIIQAVKSLKKDETLKIINVFEPFPLIKILKDKGLTTWTNKISESEYHTFFKKDKNNLIVNTIDNTPIKDDFDATLASYGSNLKEIDVRLLEMPEPMVTILDELERLPKNHVLLVNHKKVPQFLLPELKKRAYTWLSKELSFGHTLLLIFKS